MIRLGICTGLDNAALVKRLGFDYIELSLSAAAAMSDEEYLAAKASLVDAGIKAEAFNVMIPTPNRLTGPDTTLDAVRDHLGKAIPRAAGLGGQVVVFGSGGARKVPERFAAFDAWTQLIAYLKMAADIVRPYGIKIAIEPLRKAETNIIHTVREASALAAAVDDPMVGVLGDTYHMDTEGEPYSAFVDAKDRLLHVHTAEAVRRVYPTEGDGTDYAGLFAALKQADYNGRVSVEGKAEAFEAEAAAARDVLIQARG